VVFGPKVGQSSAGKVKSQQHGNKDDVKNSVSTGQKRVDGWGWLCFLGASMGGLNGSGGFWGFWMVGGSSFEELNKQPANEPHRLLVYLLTSLK